MVKIERLQEICLMVISQLEAYKEKYDEFYDRFCSICKGHSGKDIINEIFEKKMIEWFKKLKKIKKIILIKEKTLKRN